MLKKILALVVLVLILLSLLICILRPNGRSAVSPNANEISPAEPVISGAMTTEGTTMQSDENAAYEPMGLEDETVYIEPLIEIQESAGDIEMETMFGTIITEKL